MKLFRNEKGDSLIEIIITCFVLFSIGSCVFGGDDETDQKLEKITKNVKVVTEAIEKARNQKPKEKEVKKKHIIIAKSGCVDGFKTVTINGVLFYLGHKDSWDDIKPIKCDE